MTSPFDNLMLAEPIMGLEPADLVLTIVLSIGIFASVFLMIVAVFRQGGEVHMSPLREAAIATGHDDRKTIFENPYLRPILWLFLAGAFRLNMPSVKKWLRQTLTASGNFNYFTPEEYLATSMFTGMCLGVVMVLMNLLLAGTFEPAGLLAGFVIGTSLSLLQLHSRAGARVRLIARKVPYALDLIALAMGAGATFTEAVRTVARENKSDPFNVELNSMLAEIDLGATRKRAMQNLADRVPLESLRNIVASVIQAEELGTPLGDVLHAQATLLRLQRTVHAENAAAVASVRILVPSLLILISVVLMIFAPAIVAYVRSGGF